jgi:hypothetical protein
LISIFESSSSGGDSLTPDKACFNWQGEC